MSKYSKIKCIDKVEGFLSDREAYSLFLLASKLKGKGVIVEIGSWKGKSTVCLAKGLETVSNKCGNKDYYKIYAIDPHTGSSEHNEGNKKVWTFDEFKRNIKEAKVEDCIVPIVKTSVDAKKDVKEPVEVLFIDGAHEYEFVKLDYETWFDKLVDVGYIAFHDTPWEGVKKVVEHVLKTDKYKKVYFTDTLLYAQKASKITFLDKFRTSVMLRLRQEFEDICKSTGNRALKKRLKNKVKFFRMLVSVF